MLKSKWADSLLGHYRSTNGIARLNACQAQTNIPLSCREIHEMSPKVWSVANNGYVRGFLEGAEVLCATTRVSNVYLWYLPQVPPPQPPPSIFSGWDTTSNSKISTWGVWCHPESLFVHRARTRVLSGVWYHLALIFITQQLRLSTVLFTWSNRTCCYPVY